MDVRPEKHREGRKLDLGILLVLGCSVLIPFLLWYLVANWEGLSTEGTAPAQTRQQESEEPLRGASSRSAARRIARENGERNARDYRRRLARELEEAEVALQQARNQARLDPQPEMAKHWQTIIDEKSKAVQASSRRLSDFADLLK